MSFDMSQVWLPLGITRLEAALAQYDMPVWSEKMLISV